MRPGYTYQEAEKRIYDSLGASHGKSDFHLERIKYLLKKLGDPQNSLSFVHITGTSGKGSTATFLSTIFYESGYKIGLYTSPHFQYMRERIGFNNAVLSEESFVGTFSSVWPIVEKMKDSNYGTPSYFEILFAMGLVYYREQQADLVIVEAGVGHQFDTTNCIHPLVSIITNVGYDHQSLLGKSLPEIAKAKSALIKKGCYVVTGVRDPEVFVPIQKQAFLQKAKIEQLGDAYDFEKVKSSMQGTSFVYQTGSVLTSFQTSLLGQFQAENAAHAIRCAEVLHQSFGFEKVSIDAMQRGIANAFIPGRLEIVEKNPLVLLDGAHSLVKMASLITFLETVFPPKSLTIVFGSTHPSNLSEQLILLSHFAKNIILTEFRIAASDKRYVASRKIYQKMMRKIKPPIPVFYATDLDEAFLKAKADNGNIVITGSMYLIGACKNWYATRDTQQQTSNS